MEHINKDFVGWFTFPRLYRDMVNRFPDGSTLIEAGTYEGKSFAYLIVEALNAGKKFNIIGIDTFVWDGLLDKFNSNMKPLEGEFKIIIDDIAHCADSFPDKSVDFFFLDGNHTYEAVSNDIKKWLPKIKSGGILAGHDYDFQDHPGVIQSISEAFGDDWNKDYVDEVCWVKEVK